MLKIIAFTFFALFLFYQPTYAADERFIVEIKVDVTDENASIAREKALAGASRAAITAVAGRISTQDGANRIASMTDAQLINFIKETSVIDEKNSDVRYIANLRILVNEDLLKEYMLERDIPLVSRSDVSIMVIPIFRELSDDAPILWEADNPWKQAWDSSTNTSAIKIFPIQNSIGNMETIDAVKSAERDIAALEKVMKMSGASDVYILDASYNGIEGLIVNVYSLSGEDQTFKISGAKSSGAELFNKAVTDIRRELETLILNKSQNQPATENELTILYPFVSLGQWITAEQRIKSINEISEIQVQAMAQGRAQFKILYRGSLELIQKQLLPKGYRLENGGNYMILHDIGE